MKLKHMVPPSQHQIKRPAQVKAWLDLLMILKAIRPVLSIAVSLDQMKLVHTKTGKAVDIPY
eukprot:6647331-Ditylum_brightwellii.AAC.1